MNEKTKREICPGGYSVPRKTTGPILAFFKTIIGNLSLCHQRLAVNLPPSLTADEQSGSYNKFSNFCSINTIVLHPPFFRDLSNATTKLIMFTNATVQKMNCYSARGLDRRMIYPQKGIAIAFRILQARPCTCLHAA